MKAVFLDCATILTDEIDSSGLRAALPDVVFYATSPPDTVPGRIADVDVVITNKVRINRRALAAAPRLKLICLAATGTDNIDLEAAREQGVAVSNIRDYCTASVVQHVFALILALTRRLPGYSALATDGRWRAHPTFCVLDEPIRELGGLTLGIVGHGALGAAVAAAAPVFGLNARIAARSGQPPQTGRVALSDLLATADILSLHCPLTAQTKGMIDSAALASMKNTALLINTARGALVDSVALANALRAGRLAGAGIDVLDQEPPTAGDPLLDPSIPNLLVTPHIAWASTRARQRGIDEIVANIAAFGRGDLRNSVI